MTGVPPPNLRRNLLRLVFTRAGLVEVAELASHFLEKYAEQVGTTRWRGLDKKYNLK